MWVKESARFWLQDERNAKRTPINFLLQFFVPVFITTILLLLRTLVLQHSIEQNAISYYLFQSFQFSKKTSTMLNKIHERTSE